MAGSFFLRSRSEVYYAPGCGGEDPDQQPTAFFDAILGTHSFSRHSPVNRPFPHSGRGVAVPHPYTPAYDHMSKPPSCPPGGRGSLFEWQRKAPAAVGGEPRCDVRRLPLRGAPPPALRPKPPPYPEGKLAPTEVGPLLIPPLPLVPTGPGVSDRTFHVLFLMERSFGPPCQVGRTEHIIYCAREGGIFSRPDHAGLAPVNSPFLEEVLTFSLNFYRPQLTEEQPFYFLELH